MSSGFSVPAAAKALAGTQGSGFRPAGAVWAARVTLAAVFLYAAVPKIADPAGFAKSIFNYQLLPDAAINLLALFLPWLELLTAVALLAVPRLRRGALLLLGGMLLVFILAISSAMLRGLNIDCGCFSTGGTGTRAALPHLLLDIVLLIAAGWLWKSEDGRRTTEDG